MALNTGINSLDAGAPDIKYTGKEGPQENKRTAGLSNYLQYVQAMHALNQDPMPIGIFHSLEGIMSLQDMVNMGSPGKAQGGRMGLRFGGHPHSSDSPGGSGQTNGNQGNQGTWQPSSPPYQPSVENVAATEVGIPETTIDVLNEALNTDLTGRADLLTEVDIGLPERTVAEQDKFAGVTTGDGAVMESVYDTDYPVYEGTEDTEGQAEVDLAFAINKGLLQKDPTTGDIVEGRNVRDLETGEIVPREEPTITTGGEGEGPIVTDTTSTVPLTTEDTGLTADENAAAVADLDYGQTFPTEFQAVPHPEYGLGAFTPTVTAPQISFEAPGAARGGRIPAAYGGIMGQDGRRQYGLGSIFKSITKPIKKIIKSPIGKAALLAAAMYATKGMGPVGEAGGWKKFLLGAPGTAAGGTLAHLGKASTSGVLGKLGLTAGAGSWMPSPFAGILAAASIPLWAKPENWDEMDQAEQEAWLKEYHSKVASYKEQYGGDMPVGLTPASGLPHQFAAQGGRIGLKNGRSVSVREAALKELYGLYDDDEEDTWKAAKGGRTGIKQLFSDTWRAAKGGRIGYQQGAQVDPRMKQSYTQNVAENQARREINQALRGTGSTGTGYGQGSIDQLYSRYGIFGTQYSGNKFSTTGPAHTGILANQRAALEKEIAARIMQQGQGQTTYTAPKPPPQIAYSAEARALNMPQYTYSNLQAAGHDPLEQYIKYQNRLMTQGMNYGTPGTSSYTGPDLLQYTGQGQGQVLGLPSMNLPAPTAAQAADPNWRPPMYSSYADMLKYEQDQPSRMISPTRGMSAQDYIDINVLGLSGQDIAEKYNIPYALGGRVAAQEGGLMNLGGMEKDYRQEGGFVPLGGQEKADDVPARLSKNEFVFTADAVRAAGGGDVDKGAEIMENVMENLEAGGKVSEESQGLEGARNMFATSQQLEKRII